MAAAPAYSADRQQRFAIEHITDATANKSYWAVHQRRRAVARGFGPRAFWERRKLPFSERMRWLTKAPPIAGIKPPTAAPVADPIAIEEGKPRTRTILLRTQRRRQHRRSLRPKDADIRAAGIGGFVRPFDQNGEGQNLDRLLRAQLRRSHASTIMFGQFRPGRVHAGRRSPRTAAQGAEQLVARAAEIRPAAICPRRNGDTDAHRGCDPPRPLCYRRRFRRPAPLPTPRPQGEESWRLLRLRARSAKDSGAQDRRRGPARFAQGRVG